MSLPRIIHNTDCIRCMAIHKTMVKVGAVVMCRMCYQVVFTTPDPVHDQRETYLKWLKATNDRAQEES